MYSVAVPFLQLPSALEDLVQALRHRDQDPFLMQLRWRLHLRLLALSFALTAGFFLLNLSRGRLDETGIGLLVMGGAFFWLRGHPGHNRLVVRLVLGTFLLLGSFAMLGLERPASTWSALALMIMPIFGAVLDGFVTGFVTTAVVVAVLLCALLGPGQVGMPLVVAFAVPASLCTFSTSLAHTWLFNRVVLRCRASAQTVAATGEATETLARTLSEEVTQANVRLGAALDRGLEGLGLAGELREILAQARRRLPESLPRNPLDGAALLEELRGDVHRFFMVVALCVDLAAMLFLRLRGLPLWQLPTLLALATAVLLWVGRDHARGWRWRLGIFLGLCLAVMAADVLLSRANPPAASLVFLPLVVFYAGMLLGPRPAWTVAAAGLGLLALAWPSTVPVAEGRTYLSVLAMISLTMAGIGHAAVPLYRHLLESLSEEERRLQASLQAYRRLVSTLFHDLANPLAVLQALAALPPEARADDDLPRARRMVERLQSISDSARFTAHSQSAGLRPVTVAALGEELRDIFKEPLLARSLVWTVEDGAGLSLRQGGSLLRDSILGNLLSNAIHFSPVNGRITLGAQAGDGGIWLRIGDQGPGFSDAVLHDLARGAAPRPEPSPSGVQGSGFGLLLAQTYARDLGGRLILANRAGGGAQAELWLPD